ncbi:lactonase family protein [Eggerthella guodeyinii]|uniref:lactonase family protein n=1 Tax=Eggerthella guodeyinii TaxID=2690837 RepID=UPI002E25FFAB
MSGGPSRRLFAGGYTGDAEHAGIHTLAFDEDRGEARVVRTDGCAPNPSYLARRGPFLYAAHELDACGRMASYAIEADGSLTCRGACTAPRDAGTCFVLPDPSGCSLYGANYLSGSIGCCALLDDGRLVAGLPSRRHEGRGLRDDRQEAPHVHSLSFVPGTRLLVAVDLGIDALVIYPVDACGAIAPEPVETVRVAAGSGPRMVAYHPRLPVAALANELACNVLLFRFDEAGLHWRPVAQLTLPQTPDGDALAAHIAFAPDGRQLYASVRGSDRLATFQVDERGRAAGRWDVGCGGRGPRHFALSPDGRFLAVANLASDDVRLFERDAADGAVRAVAHVHVPQPACVVWDA